MNCNCGRQSMFERSYEGRSYCAACFSRQIERKIKSTLRHDDLLRKNMILNLQGSNSEILKFVLKKYFQPWNIKFSKKGNKIFTDDLDDTTLAIVRTAMNGDMSKIKINKSPLRHIPKNELILYAKLNIIKIKTRKQLSIEKTMNIIINGLEKKRPGTKYQIIKFVEKIHNE